MSSEFQGMTRAQKKALQKKRQQEHGVHSDRQRDTQGPSPFGTDTSDILTHNETSSHASPVLQQTRGTVPPPYTPQDASSTLVKTDLLPSMNEAGEPTSHTTTATSSDGGTPRNQASSTMQKPPDPNATSITDPLDHLSSPTDTTHQDTNSPSLAEMLSSTNVDQLLKKKTI